MTKSPLFKRQTWIGDMLMSVCGLVWSTLLAWWLIGSAVSLENRVLETVLGILGLLAFVSAVIWVVIFFYTAFRIRSYDNIW